MKKDKGWQEVSMRASAHQLSPTSPQHESCVSVLPRAPFPLRSYLPDSRQFDDCVVPPPPLFFFLRIVELRGHGGEWETGYCISFIDWLFSLVRQLDLPHFLDHPDSLFIDCQCTVPLTSDLAVLMLRFLFNRWFGNGQIWIICLIKISIHMHMILAWLHPDINTSSFHTVLDGHGCK